MQAFLGPGAKLTGTSPSALGFPEQ